MIINIMMVRHHMQSKIVLYKIVEMFKSVSKKSRIDKIVQLAKKIAKEQVANKEENNRLYCHSAVKLYGSLIGRASIERSKIYVAFLMRKILLPL